MVTDHNTYPLSLLGHIVIWAGIVSESETIAAQIRIPPRFAGRVGAVEHPHFSSSSSTRVIALASRGAY